MRPSVLLFCLALAGCAGANASGDVTPSTSAGPAHAQASAQEEWWKQGGVSRDKINAMCWMKYEKGHADLPIDKRADLVNACVEQTLKEQGPF